MRNSLAYESEWRPLAVSKIQDLHVKPLRVIQRPPHRRPEHLTTEPAHKHAASGAGMATHAAPPHRNLTLSALITGFRLEPYIRTRNRLEG